MNKLVIAAGSTALLALASQAGAATLTYDLTMTGAFQRSSSGSLSTLKWDGCTTYSVTTGCINPGNTNLAAAGIVPSTAVWQWNDDGVLSMTGSFNAAATIGSSGSAAASMVIGDKVTNLSINTITHTVSASSYACGEGNFLANVGANGCLDLDLGADGVLNSTVAYNVGGDATCVQLTVGGDDDNMSGGELPRGLTARAAGGGCDATTGAFDMFTVHQNDNHVGGKLVIGIATPITAAGAAWLEFNIDDIKPVPAVPVPGAVWLFGSALGLAGMIRRRKAA